MATLHGILAELGIEAPVMHPEREVHPTAGWVVDQPFAPVEGKSYEVAYGRITYDGAHRHVLKKIRVDGAAPSQWFDLDRGEPLDPELQALPVRAFRQID